MRKIWTCFFILWSLASADLVAQVDRIELGYQTTKRGIVWYRPGLPTHVPYWQFSRDTNAVMWHDTLTAIRYDWDYSDDRWRAKGTFSGPLPPPAEETSGSALIDYRTAYWIRDTFNLLHKYDSTANAWTPWGDWFYLSSAPTDIAAGVSNGAAKYTRSLWQDSDDNLVRYWDGDSWELLGTGAESDVITLADSAALKAYTGIARGVVLRQQGREGLFTQTTTSRAHDGYMVFEDAAGRKWVRITEDDVLNVKWFGAIGNGVADDYYAIQRAIDYSVYEDTTIKKVFIPSGNYLVSRTIHMGYGSAYSSVSLVGDGAPTFRGEQQFNGATITVNFSNAPALNIQGARNSTVDNITFIGLNEITGYLTDTSASNLSNWIYSGLDTIGDNRYTPYAAITVDAYAGSAPTPAYPNVLFPSYTGISTQYSKLSSSQVKIRNVHIYKFTVGIVVKPNADNNGDFVQIEKAIIERVAYGISIGNSQARNTRISDCYIDAHTCITNSKHGAQIGRISVIENVHFGGHQWLDLGAPAYLEGLEINDCYGESFQWIGSIGIGTVGAFPAITFNGCKFQPSALINRILTPTANLTGNAVYNFNHCSFQSNRIYLFENDQAALINFNQCNFGSYPGLGEPGDTVQTYHTQYFRGFDFIVATNPTSVHVNQCRFHEIANSAGGGLYPNMKGDNTALSTDLNYGNFWAKSNLDGSDVQFADLGFISTTNTLTAFTGGVSLTDRAFQGTCSSNFQQGIGTGDLLLFQYNDNTLPVVVTSVTGLVIQGQIMSGYAYNSGGAYTYMLQDTNISTGYVRHFSSRKLLNKKTVFGDFVSGSRIVNNVSYLFDNSDAADELLVSTPLLNADGYLNAIPSPVTVATYIDSIISSTSFRISANATKTGRYEIRNCFLGTNSPNDLAIPVQEIVFGSGPGIKSEAAFNYDSTNNRIGLNSTPSRQITLGHKSGETSSTSGILFESSGVADADPLARIEFKSTYTGPYTQRGYIAFDGFSNAGASPKGQALIFGLTTDGQSVAGTTSLYENQLIVNNSTKFIIANNTGRLQFAAPSASGIYSADVPWLLGGSAYTTVDVNARLKLGGDNSDTSTTKYGLRVFNGFNQPYFSARNDGNIILGGRTVASRFLFLERTGAGTNYTSWRADDQASNSEYIWPVDTAAVGDVLTYINTSGQTAWSAPADGSPTNELQTLDNTSTDTTHTVTLSNSGGSFQAKEGVGISLSTSGTGLNGILTISSTATDTSGQNIDFYISNDSLYIVDGGGSLFVDLDPYLDNTDTSGYNLDFYISGDTLYIEDGDGQLFVPLAPYVNVTGLNGIYGDGTATSGNDTLPPGGSTVTLPGQWQPLQFNANTAAGQVWSALVVNAASCSDDRITKYLVGKSPSDSLEIYGYDCGSLVKATGGQLTLQTDKELINIGDSIYMATVPDKTTLGGIVGFTQFGSYLSQIKGTANDQVLKWNNTGSGYWYPGTDASGTITGAENGLSVVSNKIRLGGNLITAATSIEGDGNELRFFDGKLSVSSWTGFANTPVQPIRFQGAEADPTLNSTPTLDGIIEYRVHSAAGSDQSNSMTIGAYSTDADGVWMQSRSASVPNVKYPLSLQPRGGLFSVGRVGGLDALATFAGSALTGSTITGNVMHLENTGGNAKSAMGMGVGTDVLDSEIGYFDAADALRITNRNATTGTSSVRIAVGGETSDKVIVIGSSVTPNARMGVGHTATTTVKSTIDNKGSFATANAQTTGNLTLTEAHHTVRYTLNASPTFTLPSAVDCPGREYLIHHFGSAGNIILSQNVISSTGTLFNTIPARNWAYIYSDGVDWYGYRLQSL